MDSGYEQSWIWDQLWFWVPVTFVVLFMVGMALTFLWFGALALILAAVSAIGWTIYRWVTWYNWKHEVRD